MQCLSERLLASAALAGEQHRDTRGCQPFDVAADFQHGVALRDDPPDRGCGHDAREATVLLLEFGQPPCTRDNALQKVDLARLLAEIVRAERHGAQRVDAVAVAGRDNDFHLRCAGEKLGHGRDPFRYAVGVRWQAEIDDGHLRRIASRSGGSLSAIGCKDRAPAVEGPAILPAQANIILNDEEFGERRIGWWRHDDIVTLKARGSPTPPHEEAAGASASRRPGGSRRAGLRRTGEAARAPERHRCRCRPRFGCGMDGTARHARIRPSYPGRRRRCRVRAGRPPPLSTD